MPCDIETRYIIGTEYIIGSARIVGTACIIEIASNVGTLCMPGIMIAFAINRRAINNMTFAKEWKPSGRLVKFQFALSTVNKLLICLFNVQPPSPCFTPSSPAV